MRKIGEILKSEREKKDLSLHEIGMSLKINPKILKAIEDGDEKNLPAKTFLRGFIRSYAQYLRLDVDEILKQFQDEVGSIRPPEPKDELPAEAATPAQAPVVQKPKKEKPLGKAKDENLNPSSSSRVFTIIGAIVLVLLIAFVAKMVEKYQKETVLHDAQDVTTTTIPAVIPENLPAANTSEGGIAGGAPAESSAGTKTGSDVGVATGLAAAGASAMPPKASELMTPSPKSTTTSTTVRLVTTTTMKITVTTLKAVVVVPKSTTTTTTKKTTTTARATTTSTSMKPTTTTLPGKKSVEVIVEALNKVSIKYNLGDNATEILELSADQVHTFKGKDKITLEVSDGGAVSVIVNGRDRGVPGTIGQPIKLSYP